MWPRTAKRSSAPRLSILRPAAMRALHQALAAGAGLLRRMTKRRPGHYSRRCGHEATAPRGDVPPPDARDRRQQLVVFSVRHPRRIEGSSDYSEFIQDTESRHSASFGADFAAQGMIYQDGELCIVRIRSAR